MPIFKVVIEVDEPSLEDAEDHIQSLSGSDLVDEIVQLDDGSRNKGFASCDTEELDSACEVMFGHTDWEFVDSKILRRHDDENYTVVLFHHEETREEELEEEE